MTNNLELEKTLWQAADKLRNNMDAAEYKHVVLGLIFLKYISDAFDELYSQLEAEKSETGADPRGQRRIYSRTGFLCASFCTVEMAARQSQIADYWQRHRRCNGCHRKRQCDFKRCFTKRLCKTSLRQTAIR